MTQDPGEVVQLTAADAVSPIDDPDLGDRNAAAELQAIDDQETAPIPMPLEPDVDTGQEPIALEHDFDDVLDVLESTTPPSEPLAPPPRAHVKGQQSSFTPAPNVGRGVATTAAAEPEVVRQPVSRQQLRAHRNSRQFWMMMSLLFACLLGAVSWFAVSVFLKPKLSDWERKLLYAMGAPARWLPAHEGEGEPLLPTDHVKLRGDHFQLANRKDSFRDDFFDGQDDDGDPDSEEDDDDDDFGKKIARQNIDRRNDTRQNNDGRNVARQNDDRDNEFQNKPGRNEPVDRDQPNRRIERAAVDPPAQQNDVARRAPVGLMGGLAKGEAPAAFSNPGGLPPENGVARRRAPNVRNNARNNNRRNNNRNRQPKSDWEAPEISDADAQLFSNRGIDPKTLKTFSVDTDRRLNVALVGENVFSVEEGNRLSVLDLRFEEVSNSRKLDREVAAICAAVPNRITNRPAAWVLYQNGQLEKWELRDGSLNRLTSIVWNPVFKERSPVVAAGKRVVATSVGGQIVVANVIETASKIGSTVSTDIDGPVSAMRFSDDDSRLLAIVGDEAVLLDAGNGEVLSTTALAQFPQRSSMDISPDLSTLFVVRDGVIDSVSLADGTASGQYWSSVPVPLAGVVSDNESLLGLTAGSPSHAVLFSITDMVSDTPGAAAVDRDDAAESSLLDGSASDEDDRQPHELARSPKFSGRVFAIQALPNQRIAFLSLEGDRSRIGIATWQGGWDVKPLKLDAGMQITGFHMSDDLSKVVIYGDDIVQAWSIDNIESGKASFVSESVAHTNKVTALKLSNDGSRIMSGDLSGDVNVVDFETGNRTGGVRGFTTSILNIAAKGDAGFIVMDRAGVAKGSANATHDKITAFGQIVNGASALSDSGSRIAYFFGFEIRVADIRSHKVIGTLKPKDRPDIVGFSHDQKYVLLQDGRTVSVWNWRQGQRVRVFRHGTRPIPATAAHSVSKDDSTVAIVTGNGGNYISVFEMPGDQ